MPARSVHVPRPTSILLAVGLVLAACSPPATPTPSPSATVPTPTETPTPSETPAGTPTPTEVPTTGPCDPATSLAARITAWDGAAGSRFAAVTLTNTGPAICTVPALWRPQLVDGAGNVLIDGAPPGPSATLGMSPGGTLGTSVRVSNYCGPAPVAPVTVAFVLPDSSGRIVASPLSPTDTSGVPPCLGPTTPPEIEMEAWQ